MIVKVDKKGRILLPKDVREKTAIKNGSYVKIEVKGNKVIMEPIGSITDKYFGAYKVKRWPEDLDEFLEEAIRRWWGSQST